jgi:hypothetical protein
MRYCALNGFPEPNSREDNPAALKISWWPGRIAGAFCPPDPARHRPGWWSPKGVLIRARRPLALAIEGGGEALWVNLGSGRDASLGGFARLPCGLTVSGSAPATAEHLSQPPMPPQLSVGGVAVRTRPAPRQTTLDGV